MAHKGMGSVDETRPSQCTFTGRSESFRMPTLDGDCGGLSTSLTDAEREWVELVWLGDPSLE